MLNQFYMCVLTSYFTIDIKLYPVFKPNAYFFKHHWSETSGEEKWQAYQRVVREEIMAPSFGFKLFEASEIDKFDFKKIMKGKAKIEDD